MTSKPSLVVLGGRSFVAGYVLMRLAHDGLVADVVARAALAVPEGFRSIVADLADPAAWHVAPGAIVLSLLPLAVLTKNLGRLKGAQAIIALGSTSRYSKIESADPSERMLAENLEMAENILKSWCLKNGTVYTLLRPTLIYDGMGDRNIARIASMIRRLGVFPVALPGKGLRQPIHADDVARAMVSAIGNAAAYNQAYNIAGGEVLSYRAMVEKVFEAMGRAPRILALPTGLLRIAFRAGTAMGLLREKEFGFEVFQRMNQDLVFDVREGLDCLRYQPRAFCPQIV